ncbi:zf-HC2 domain-containing protein [bacterium]|nr:zf-HC2 domain-containing protein [bacterium]
MAHCEWFKDKIFEYLDQELDEETKKNVRQHLEECPLCAKFYANLKALKTGLKHIRPVQAADSFQVVLRERLRREAAHKKRLDFSSSRPRRWMPAVIAFGAVAVVAVLWFGREPVRMNSRDLTAQTDVSAAERDAHTVQYVIDDVEAGQSDVPVWRRTAHSRIDSLLAHTDTDNAIQDMIQPVRF